MWSREHLASIIDPIERHQPPFDQLSYTSALDIFLREQPHLLADERAQDIAVNRRKDWLFATEITNDQDLSYLASVIKPKDQGKKKEICIILPMSSISSKEIGKTAKEFCKGNFPCYKKLGRLGAHETMSGLLFGRNITKKAISFIEIDKKTCELGIYPYFGVYCEKCHMYKLGSLEDLFNLGNLQTFSLEDAERILAEIKPLPD